MFELKDFQKIAIDKLSISFLDLWKTGNYKLPLIFKAPTGAGKTVMMAEFLRCLDDNYQFNEDKAYIWVSFGGDESYTQSKNKLYKYYNEGTDLNLKDLSNISESKLYKNNIFFINWNKIKDVKSGRNLRKDNENTSGNYGIFDEFIKNTQKERELVLIIDEAHTETDSKLSNEVIDLINPRIIINVTATPKNIPSTDDIQDKKAGYVRVKEEDVINSGLIKEQIIIQTEEEINTIKQKGLSEDEIMLELAFNKRNKLVEAYKKLDLQINPLVLIQLPNDENDKQEVVTNKKDIILSYLLSKGVKDSEIAIWLSNEKKNLELIENNNSQVNFMIFKVAAATGWDCPRADILVMYREIKRPTFHTQMLGRIKRMPEGHHYKLAELNNAYVYTNYNKEHIRDVKEVSNENKVPIYFTRSKNDIEKINIETTFHHRTDFNTLTPPTLWQKTFLETLDNYFNVTRALDKTQNYANIEGRIDFNTNKVSNKIIAGANINSFDNFVTELKTKSKEIDYSFSELDIERLYNLLCFEELQKQTIEEAKYNSSRSWGQLKQAINVWFKTRFGEREALYDVIVNELLKENSEFKKAICKALIDFREKYNIQIKEKIEKSIYPILIPEDELSFTDEYEEISVEKNVYEKFYIKKEYKGKDNELKFINYIDKLDIDWWHKQNDSGRNVFAIEYYNSQDKKISLFYPDFIVKKQDTIYILDTKSGITAKSQETKEKAEALQKWIKDNKQKYTYNIIGGILNFYHPSWKINKKDVYIYENINDWEDIVF